MIDHDKQRRRGCSTCWTSWASPTTRIVMYSHRQRPAHELLAGRRDDALPQREELQLGGRLPGAHGRALAGQHRRRRRSATRSSATTTGCPPSWHAAGEPEIVDKLKAGATRRPARPSRCTSTASTCCPTSPARTQKGPRQGFIYFSDDGDLVALRFDNWKVVFMEQRAPGTLRVWAEPFVPLRVPKIFNLRTDPYERADITSNTYYDWLHRPRLPGARRRRRSWPSSWRRSRSSRPARRRPASPSTRCMEKMRDAAGGAGR